MVWRRVEEIRGLGYLDSAFFISFYFDNMVFLRAELPEQPLQFLTSSYHEGIQNKLNQYNLDLDIAYPALTGEMNKIPM